ncbi:MAG: hypothetical protein ACSHXK_09815 [Oceanococcus sp.]
MAYYVDPKRPRHLGKKGRAAKMQAMAEQRAAEARRQKWRLLVHGIIMYLGVWSFRHTDIHSDDPFEAGTLIFLDILFALYLMAMLFIEVWRNGSR